MENHFKAAYRDAFELAKKKLLALDIAQVCAESGARIVARTTATKIELLYLNSLIFLELPSCKFSSQAVPEVHIWDQILLLHYLTSVKPEFTADRQLGFKELKSAALYYRLFEARCLKPLIQAFGNQPDLLLENALPLNGQTICTGDASARLQVLPNISVSCILWKADEEFPASASILFDSTIERYLSAEDIVVMCQRMVLKLLRKW